MQKKRSPRTRPLGSAQPVGGGLYFNPTTGELSQAPALFGSTPEGVVPVTTLVQDGWF